MTQLRKTWAEKAMTGAKLRVIRALLGLKGTYTHEELKKNFAIPTVVFSPDYSDPNVRQAMLTQGMQSVNNMFGTPEIPVRRVDFETENTFDVSEYADNPAFQSDIPEDDFLENIRNRYTMELPLMSRRAVILHKRKTDFFVMIAEQRSTKEFTNTL